MFCSVLQDINYIRQMQKPRLNNKAEMITTEGVLKKADFRVSLLSLRMCFRSSEACVYFVGCFCTHRWNMFLLDQNVRFLAQFITEAGILVKRKQVRLNVSRLNLTLFI